MTKTPSTRTNSRREYFDLCMAQPTDWLRQAAADPSDGMRPRHVLLARLALRKKAGGRGA